MALLGAESFDLYGTTLAPLLLRGYVSAGNVAPQTTAGNARTGIGYLRSNSGFSNLQYLGKVLDVSVDVFGAGVGIRPVAAPVADRKENQGIGCGDGTFLGTVKVAINSSQGFDVYVNGVFAGATANNLWVVGSYYWVEFMVRNNTANGGVNTASVEVRDANGNGLVTINGLNIPASISRCGLGSWDSNSGLAHTEVYFDDWIYYDNNGGFDDTFFGDTLCTTLMVASDTLQADWEPSTGVGTPGFSLLNSATPNDATFVQALNIAGDVSAFGTGGITYNTTVIRALIPVVRNLKTDAGVATFTVGIESAGFTSVSSDKIPQTTAAYASEIFARNPDGNVPWTKTTGSNALLRIERTS